MNEIIIDLDSSTSAKSFKKDKGKKESIQSLIHYEEFKRVENFVNDAITRAKNVKDLTGEKDADELFEHNTISVSGSRGSGKTSFLLSIRDHFRHDTDNIEVPGVIDPTLIEDKGHIFLNVLSLLSDLMNKGFTQRECRNDPHILSDKKIWDLKLQKLAEGIPSINGVDSNIQGWHDAQFVMKTGLSHVKAARELRKHFSILIDAVLKELKKDALLLIFDDIDVDSSKGWQLLETLRKYCTSPKLITIISGDEKLYLNLVRQQKWLGFGSEIVKYEATHAPNGAEKWGYFNDIVTDLSGQYLQKILPTRYRIHLNTLLEKRMNQDYGTVKVKRKDIGENIEIGKWYSEIIARTMGITNPTQGEVFITFMLSQPLRTQLQFLSAADLYLTSEQRKRLTSDSTEGPNDNRYDTYSKNLTDTIINLFHQDLQEQNLNLEQFGNSPKFHNVLALRWLVAQGSLRDLYQLQPVTTNRSINACLFSLSAMTAGYFREQNTFLIFDYFVRIAYTRNLLDVIGENVIQNSGVKGITNGDETATGNRKSRLQMLCEVSWLFGDTVLRDSVNQMHGFIYGIINPSGQRNFGLFNDFIRLRGLEKTQKRKLENRIDGVLDRRGISRIEQILGYIPAFKLSFSDYYKNSSEICYSVHSLLSTVGEIVKRHNILYTDEQEKIAEIERSLNSLSQLREYPIILSNDRSASSGNVDLNDLGFEEPIIGEDLKLQVPKFAQSLCAWCDAGRSLPVATHLLGKAFTRFYFSLKGIADENRKGVGLGRILHLQIIAFFNSVLIEEAQENPDAKFAQMNIRGIRTSDTNFIFNLRAVLRSDENTSLKDISNGILPLSRWLMQCPLLLAYVDFDLDRNKDLFQTLQGLNTIDLIWLADIGMYDTLNEIDIKFKDGADGSDTGKAGTRITSPGTKLNANEQRILILKELGFTKSFVEDSKNNKEILKKVGNAFGNMEYPSNTLSAIRAHLKKNPDAW
jgi:hypothetical protein